MTRNTFHGDPSHLCGGRVHQQIDITLRGKFDHTTLQAARTNERAVVVEKLTGSS